MVKYFYVYSLVIWLYKRHLSLWSPHWSCRIKHPFCILPLVLASTVAKQEMQPDLYTWVNKKHSYWDSLSGSVCSVTQQTVKKPPQKLHRILFSYRFLVKKREDASSYYALLPMGWSGSCEEDIRPPQRWWSASMDGHRRRGDGQHKRFVSTEECVWISRHFFL